MATPTIPNGEEHFFVTKYEGNGGGQRVGKFVPFTDNGTIDNSVIFNDGDSAYLSRTPSGTGNRRTFTFSGWVKRGVFNTTTGNDLFNAGTNSGNDIDQVHFDSSLRLRFYSYGVSAGAYLFQYITNRTFEDTSKFYHIVCAVDTTQSSASDRVKIYVDGDLITSFSTETDPALNGECYHFNNTNTHYIGASIGNLRFLDGYIAEYNFVDGQQLTPASFGVTDTSTGRWIPKTLSGITYGTNGFRLKFQDSSALGDDTSGNTNDFTATNLSASDQTTDSPTQNFATFDSNRNGGDWTLSEGNLKIVGTPSTGAGRICLSGMNIPNSNKIYWEVEVDVNNDSPRLLGIFRDTVSLTAGSSTEDMRYIAIRNGGTQDGKVWDGTSTSSQLTTTTSGDIIQFARDGEKLWIGKNNTWLNSGNPSTGANPLLTNIDTNSNWKMGVWSVSAGLPSGTSHTFIANTGQRSFAYTAPTGFSAWNQDNLPETAKGVSGLVWTKNRDSTDNHQLYDSSRGKQLLLSSDISDAESTVTDGLQKFLAGGQQIEDSDAINTAGESFISWNWVADGGSTSSNTDGSITSTVQANTTAGFSIIQYVGTSSNATVGHGLGQKPDWVMLKNLDQSSAGSGDWMVWHKSIANTEYLSLNDSDAKATLATAWNSTSPTSSVISIGTATRTNNSGDDHVIYAWHSVDGFSKFGSYTGNGNADGTFVYTGFRPTWVMVKRTNTTGSWLMWDTKRDAINPMYHRLYANLTNAQGTSGADIDFLSNGFKHRRTDSDQNASGSTYVYMAFAEHPFVGDGTSPVTAR